MGGVSCGVCRFVIRLRWVLLGLFFGICFFNFCLLCLACRVWFCRLV